jgi:hypothetical protein
MVSFLIWIDLQELHWTLLLPMRHDIGEDLYSRIRAVTIYLMQDRRKSHPCRPNASYTQKLGKWFEVMQYRQINGDRGSSKCSMGLNLILKFHYSCFSQPNI